MLKAPSVVLRLTSRLSGPARARAEIRTIRHGLLACPAPVHVERARSCGSDAQANDLMNAFDFTQSPLLRSSLPSAPARKLLSKALTVWPSHGATLRSFNWNSQPITAHVHKKHASRRVAAYPMLRTVRAAPRVPRNQEQSEHERRRAEAEHTGQLPSPNGGYSVMMARTRRNASV